MADLIRFAEIGGSNDPAKSSDSTVPAKPIFAFADMFSHVEPEVVKIRIPDTTHFGAGFFVSVGDKNSCDIATSNHVTNGLDEINAVDLHGHTFVAKLQKVDLPHELSIYQLQGVPDPDKTCKPVELGSVPSSNEILLGVGEIPGDTLETGMPTASPYLTQALGWVSRNEREFPALAGEDMNRQMIAMFTVGQHGFSGGPVFDYHTKVVGIGAGGAGFEMLMEPVQYLIDDLAELKAEREKH